MAIYKNCKIAKARKLGRLLGREGISLEVQKCIAEYDGSYKGAMELCGKMILWADASTFDLYWEEQVQRGLSKAESVGLQIMSSNE